MEKLFYNGNVITLNKRRDLQEAVYVCNDKIVKVGNNQDLFEASTEKTEKIDLKGKTLIPGIIDSHTHLSSMGFTFIYSNLSQVKTVEEGLAILSDAVASHNTEVIIGFNCPNLLWADKAYISRKTLDNISNKIPVMAIRADGHFMALNGKAIEKYGLENNIRGSNPKEGIFTEEGAKKIWKILGDLNNDKIEEALIAASEYAVSQGITSIHDFAIYSNCFAFSKLGPRLRLRTNLFLWENDRSLLDIRIKELKNNIKDSNMLKFGGVKLFADGVIDDRSAANYSPYNQDLKNSGNLLLKKGELREITGDCNRDGLQVAVHAIGEKAIEYVIDEYENRRTINNDVRNRIEHLELADVEHFRRMAECNIIASMQPNFLDSYERGAYKTILPKHLYNKANSFQSALACQVPLAFGSDMLPFDPWFGISQTINSTRYNSCLNLEDALLAYTAGGAYASFEEDIKGTIENEKLADIIVLNKDPYKCEDFDELRVEKTYLGGMLVYNNQDVNSKSGKGQL